jgi:hypothetical protein
MTSTFAGFLRSSDELIDETVTGFGVAEGSLCEVGEEEGDGAVVHGRGHAVETDGQGAGCVVGCEIGT